MLSRRALTLQLAALGLLSSCSLHAQPPSELPVSLYTLPMVSLDGQPFAADQLKGKVVLFVNVASRCGFTKQYDGLQKLYSELEPQGFVIVGVPCNQFGSQEPGSADEIQSFCRMNFGVEFPLLEKQDVNGDQRSELYTWLVHSEAGQDKKVSWNFEKFLISRSGEVLERYRSSVGPDDDKLRAAIESALKG